MIYVPWTDFIGMLWTGASRIHDTLGWSLGGHTDMLYTIMQLGLNEAEFQCQRVAIACIFFTYISSVEVSLGVSRV